MFYFYFFFNQNSHRPRVWFREWMNSDQMFHAPESLAATSFRLRGQLKDVKVEARAHQRQGNAWNMVYMKVTILDPDAPKEFVVFNKETLLPLNMTAKTTTNIKM